MTSVLDASAVLALFIGEPVTDQLVEAVEEGAFMSAANLAEVVGRLIRLDRPDLVAHVTEAANVAVVPLLEDLAVRAGELLTIGRPLGLSFADRCCLATGEAFNARILTTDRAWLELPSPWRERITCVRPN